MKRGAILAVLVCAALAAPAAVAADGWAALHRPPHLPKLAPGAKCPVSRVDRRIAWKGLNVFGGTGIGPGPVYPGLGGSSGLLWATRDEQFGGPWYGEKVFWYISPAYRGPVLIRGHRLDGPQAMGFNGTRTPERELRIAPLESVSWAGQPKGSRGIASGVRVLKPGCYGFQIDGTSFSRVVVVTVDLAS